MNLLDKNQILKMSRHVFLRSSGVPDKRLLHPRREWGIGLCLFAVLLLTGSALTAQTFTQFRDLSTIAGEASLTIPRYNEHQVQTVLELYAVRSQAYQALISDTSFATQYATSSVVDETNEAGDSTATSTTQFNSDVLIEARYEEKLVYGDNFNSLDIPAITAHCAAEGGVLNECGSVCPATAEVCTEQCAYTCEFDFGAE